MGRAVRRRRSPRRAGKMRPPSSGRISSSTSTAAYRGGVSLTPLRLPAPAAVVAGDAATPATPATAPAAPATAPAATAPQPPRPKPLPPSRSRGPSRAAATPAAATAPAAAAAPGLLALRRFFSASPAATGCGVGVGLTRTEVTGPSPSSCSSLSAPTGSPRPAPRTPAHASAPRRLRAPAPITIAFREAHVRHAPSHGLAAQRGAGDERNPSLDAVPLPLRGAAHRGTCVLARPFVQRAVQARFWTLRISRYRRAWRYRICRAPSGVVFVAVEFLSSGAGAGAPGRRGAWRAGRGQESERAISSCSGSEQALVPGWCIGRHPARASRRRAKDSGPARIACFAHVVLPRSSQGPASSPWRRRRAAVGRPTRRPLSAWHPRRRGRAGSRTSSCRGCRARRRCRCPSSSARASPSSGRW